MIRTLHRRRARARRDALESQLPEVARALARATAAGLPFAAACERAGEAVEGPGRAALQAASDRSRAGAVPADALADLAAAGGQGLVAAVAIHAEVGGDLVRSLRAIGDGLGASRRLRGDVAVALAQARFAARIVPAIPVGALALTWATSPETVAPLLDTTVGRGILVVAAALDAIALLLLRAIAAQVGR
jgi:tight adherence protein B